MKLEPFILYLTRSPVSLLTVTKHLNSSLKKKKKSNLLAATYVSPDHSEVLVLYHLSRCLNILNLCPSSWMSMVFSPTNFLVVICGNASQVLGKHRFTWTKLILPPGRWRTVEGTAGKNMPQIDVCIS